MDEKEYWKIMKNLKENDNENERFKIISGRIYKKDRNQELRKIIRWHELLDILKRSHDDPLGGHFGIKKMYEKLKERYYWKNMTRDIREYVSSCDSCQRYKIGEKGEELHPIKIYELFERVGIDIVGPLPEKKRRINIS